MATTDKATRRTPRTAPVVIVDKSETATPPAAPNAAPEGTSVPTLVVVPPTTDAGVNLAEAVGLAPDVKALEVPATPTDAQVQARIMRGDMQAAWAKFFAKCPVNIGAFVEPDPAAIKAMRIAYMTEKGMDLTDIDAHVDAGMTIKDQIDAARKAHEASAASGNGVKLEWLHASRVEILDVLANVDTMISAAGGKVQHKTTSTSSTGGTRKAKSTPSAWKERAPKLIAYAESLGLVGVYLVDITVGGYKGKPHPVRLHADGTWTKATYNFDTHQVTDTGIQVPTWKYFDKDGNDRTDETPKDMVPQHSLAKGEMFGVLMLKKDGTILDIDGLTADRRDENNKRKAGSRKDYALVPAFFTAAGVELGE